MKEKGLQKLNVTDQKSVVGGFVYHFRVNGVDCYYVPHPIKEHDNCVQINFIREMAIDHELEAGRNPGILDYITEIEARIDAMAEAYKIARNGITLWKSANMDDFLKHMKISARDLW